MKKKVPYNQIPLLSFPDFGVLFMNIQLEMKEIKIDLEGSVIAGVAPKLLGQGFLSFKNWKKISIKKFSSNKWSDTQDSLREICEFVCQKKDFTLRGFGKSTGQWIEYIIMEASVEAQFDEIQ